MNRSIVRMKISDLVPHELTCAEHTEELVVGMRNDGLLWRPIAVHELGGGKYMIIDGHHRVAALTQLGCSYVMVNVVDYFSPEIRVRSWNGDGEWDKREIVEDALKNRLKSPKTTKHTITIYDVEQTFHDNDIVEPIINTPIKSLQRK
jgi:hypothetical protein